MSATRKRWAMGLAAAAGAASFAAGLGAMRAADQQQAIAASTGRAAGLLRAQLWVDGELRSDPPRRMASGAKLYCYGVASTAAGAALLALAVSGHLWELADSRGRRGASDSARRRPRREEQPPATEAGEPPATPAEAVVTPHNGREAPPETIMGEAAVGEPDDQEPLGGSSDQLVRAVRAVRAGSSGSLERDLRVANPERHRPDRSGTGLWAKRIGTLFLALALLLLWSIAGGSSKDDWSGSAIRAGLLTTRDHGAWGRAAGEACVLTFLPVVSGLCGGVAWRNEHRNSGLALVVVSVFVAAALLLVVGARI